MGMTGILRKWGQMLWEYHGDGNRSCGNSAWMKFVYMGALWNAVEILLMIKIHVQALEY